MIQAWAFGSYFEEHCLKFIRENKEFDEDFLMEDVSKLCLERMVSLVESTDRKLNDVLVNLLIEWLRSGKNIDAARNLTLTVSFKGLNNDDKIKFYKNIKNKMDSESSVACANHIFDGDHESSPKFDRTKIMKVLHRVKS